MKISGVFFSTLILSSVLNCSDKNKSSLSISESLIFLTGNAGQNSLTNPLEIPGLSPDPGLLPDPDLPPGIPGTSAISIKMEGLNKSFTVQAAIPSPRDHDIYIDVAENTASTGILNDDYHISTNPIVITAGNTSASTTITVNPARDVSIDREFDFDIQDTNENDYDKDRKCKMKIKGTHFSGVYCDVTEVSDPDQSNPANYAYHSANLYSAVNQYGAPGIGIDVPDMVYPYSMAASPDGNNVYITSLNGAKIMVFTRDTSTGALSILETFRRDTGGGTANEIPGLWYPYEITVSPDGKNVYAVASDVEKLPDDRDVLYVFSRNLADGSLSLIQTFSDTGITVGAQISTMAFLFNIEISPDGKFLYTVATDDRAVNVFSRNLTDGTLTFITVYQDKSKDAVNGIDGMNSPKSIKISSDGKHAFLASGSFMGENHGCILYFNRNVASGLLSVKDTYCSSLDTANTAKAGITALDSISYPHEIAMTSNSQFVYISDLHNGEIHTFHHDSAANTLTYSNTFATWPYGMLAGNWLKLSDDDSTLISGMIKVNVFSVDSADGSLTQTHTFMDISPWYSQYGISGKYVEGLRTPMNMVFSPDGSSFYVAGFDDHSVVHFQK